MRRVLVGAVLAGLALTGCGGTRMSDEAIEAAAGIGGVQVSAEQVATGADAQAAPGAVPATAGVPAPSSGTASSTPGVAAPGPAAVAIGGTGATPNKNAPSSNVGATASAQTPTGPVTRKSVIKLGAVGTFSGPVGALVKDTVTGIRVWAQATNAAGGINGHPIEVLVGDDGGDPARFIQVLKKFVEQDGALAMLYTTLGFAPNGNNAYLDSKKIYTFAHEGGLDVPYTNPYVLTPTAAGSAYADLMALAFGAGLNAQGTKLATFACSDFSLCDLFDKRITNKTVLDKAGFSLVARGRPSLTQPDYTAQCLAAKQAGAEAVLIVLDGASIRRFAGDCARQNYRPRLASADVVVTGDLPGDKNLEGFVVGTKVASFADPRVPGMQEALTAFARYAPGQAPTGGMASGWLIGKFFAAAAKNLPDKPTQENLAEGIYSIKNNNLGGLTYPITMTRGEPMARQLCFGVVLIQSNKFTAAPGPSLRCANGGKPMSSPDDYGPVAGDRQPASTDPARRDS